MQLGPAIRCGGSPLPELESSAGLMEFSRGADSHRGFRGLRGALAADIGECWFSHRLGVQYADDLLMTPI